MKFALLTAAALIVFAACAGEPGDLQGTHSVPDSGAYLADSGGSGSHSEGPEIHVLSPAEPEGFQSDSYNFSTDEIVTDEHLAVRCLVEPNASSGARVDASSVRISATDGNHRSESTATPTGIVNEFEGELDVSDFDNGAIGIGCTARDLAPQATQNSAVVLTFLDLGPEIQILSPLVGSTYAGRVEVVFRVTPAPIIPNDPSAYVRPESVVLLASDNEAAWTADENGFFVGIVEFDDPSIFEHPPGGSIALSVRAGNGRLPAPPMRTRTVSFDLDHEGPTISLNAPLPGSLVSGVVEISVDAADASGVQPLGVYATIGGDHEVPLSLIGGSTFTGSFDSLTLGAVVFPNIVIRARDLLGNESSLGYVVTLDNASPILSLDSPALRESQLVGDVLVCSQHFDPLGSDAVSDGETVSRFFEIRARVEDRPNSDAPSANVILPVAHPDHGSVNLFILDDQNSVLLVDTTGDGLCDAINPLLVPAGVPTISDEVAVLGLEPIDSGGASFFGNDTPPTFAATSNGFCSSKGDTTQPPPLCASTPLQRVIETEADAEPAIYGVPPTGGLQCGGNAIDALGASLSEGWACAAVRGSDALGNANVSAPLRLCIDADLNQSDGCPPLGSANLLGAPNCTGTYDVQTGTVNSNIPCLVDGAFPQNEVRRIAP